ncbi:MAG: adenosine deaminase [Candidatus Howiella sp.]
MIDLHLHLDGSLSPELVRKLAYMQDIRLPDAFPQTLLAPRACGSLEEYLRRFVLPLSVMQSEESIALSVEDLLSRLGKMGLLYTEIRFAPQLHTSRGLSQTQVVQAALSGLHRAEWRGPVRPQLILCLMRGADNAKQNLETIRIAGRYLGQGVAAVDLAGAEAAYPTAEFENIFALVKEAEIPFTIHAGEALGADSVAAAVQFGASRIGHGLRAVSEPKLLAEIREKNLLLELCPTSNLQTGAAATAAAYPLRRLLDAGVRVCLNADNMTVSDTDVWREYAFAYAELGLSAQECATLLCNAAEGAFLPRAERKNLLEAVHRCVRGGALDRRGIR